ncbi:MAG: PD-(D/E)XK nuclease family protein [Planctomycetota bacterium]
MTKNSIKQFYRKYCEVKSREAGELTSEIQSFAENYDKITGNDDNQDNVIGSIEQFAQEFGKIQDNDGSDIKHRLNQFYKSYLPLYKKESDEIMNKLSEITSIRSDINYQDVFGIARSEESYTQFMEWLLDPNGSHKLGFKPLGLFLKNIVNDEFDFKLEDGVEVEAEKQEGGDRPDLTITGYKFICVIEIKIGSGANPGQIEKYFERWSDEKVKKPNKFFIFLTLWGDKPDEKVYDEKGHKGFKPAKWEQVINKVLSPLLKKSKTSVLKNVISSVIFNLKVNKFSSNNSREFFYNEEYKNADYFKLKSILQENDKEDDNE